jgi:hypothetical protein
MSQAYCLGMEVYMLSFAEMKALMEDCGALPVPILLIEDDQERVETLTDWLPPVFRLVHCRTGGAALGLLGRAGPEDFAGVMFDHDLVMHASVGAYVNGYMVGRAMVGVLANTTNVLIHSANAAASALMVEMFAGVYPTTRIPWGTMSQYRFHVWLDEVWEEAVARHSDGPDHRRSQRLSVLLGEDWLLAEPLPLGKIRWDD